MFKSVICWLLALASVAGAVWFYRHSPGIGMLVFAPLIMALSAVFMAILGVHCMRKAFSKKGPDIAYWRRPIGRFTVFFVAGVLGLVFADRIDDAVSRGGDGAVEIIFTIACIGVCLGAICFSLARDLFPYILIGDKVVQVDGLAISYLKILSVRQRESLSIGRHGQPSITYYIDIASQGRPVKVVRMPDQPTAELLETELSTRISRARTASRTAPHLTPGTPRPW